MFVLLSPAKKLDFTTEVPCIEHTECVFLSQAQELIDIAKTLSCTDLEKMMKISPKLSELNRDRFHLWARPFTPRNAKQACFAFNGDTYAGLDSYTLDEDTLKYSQNHIGILSGLYGLLRPLDLIQPYRLEMGTNFPNAKGSNLYDFWRSSIANRINTVVQNHSSPCVINCASNEYFKAVDTEQLHCPVIDIQFKEVKEGKAKIVSFSAKKARGMMARYIVNNRIENIEGVKKFNTGGYEFMEEHSTDETLVFYRYH